VQTFGIGFLAKPTNLVKVGDSMVCNFRLATIEERNSGGEKVEDTHFLDFEVWDTAAKFLHDNALVGDTIYVEATPRERSIKTGDGYCKLVNFRVTKFRLFKKQKQIRINHEI